MNETYKIHPAAAVWPMLSEQELRHMAETIKTVGLLQPIVRDKDGLIIDGRNRLAACAIADVAPTFVTHEGDAISYILISNERRHMTLPQLAAAQALTLGPENRADGPKGRRWIRGSVPKAPSGDGEDTGGSSGKETWTRYMSWAGLVLDWVPEALGEVVLGAKALDAAVTEAEKKRDADKKHKEEEQTRKEQRESLPPDLGTLVDNNRLSLKDALRRKDLPEKHAVRVNAGTLLLDEAEYLVKQEKVAKAQETKEHEEAIERYADHVRGFLASLNGIMLISGGDANRNDTLSALSDRDRKRYTDIEKLMDLMAVDHQRIIDILREG